MGEGHTTFLVGDSVILVPKHWSLSEWNLIQEEKENKTKFYINVHESHWKWVWYKEPKFWHNWNNITSFLLAGRNWFLLSLQGNLVQNIKKKKHCCCIAMITSWNAIQCLLQSKVKGQLPLYGWSFLLVWALFCSLLINHNLKETNYKSNLL